MERREEMDPRRPRDREEDKESFNETSGFNDRRTSEQVNPQSYPHAPQRLHRVEARMESPERSSGLTMQPPSSRPFLASKTSDEYARSHPATWTGSCSSRQPQHPDHPTGVPRESYRNTEDFRETYRREMPFESPSHAFGSLPFPQVQASTSFPGLTSDEHAQLQSLRTGPEAPPPMLAGLPSLDGKNFELTIRQQPLQGRLCGLGSKDKRPLDPLPIVQLRIFGQDGHEDFDAENSPNLTLQVSLLKEDPARPGQIEATLVESNDPSYPVTRMLEGRLVASANTARDIDSTRATFFVFPDLSIRQEGKFRLRFRLIVLGPPLSTSMASQAGYGGSIAATVESEPFTVYPPRLFPGMTESTDLAKALAKQGIQVPIRNEPRKKRDQSDSNSGPYEEHRHFT